MNSIARLPNSFEPIGFRSPLAAFLFNERLAGLFALNNCGAAKDLADIASHVGCLVENELLAHEEAQGVFLSASRRLTLINSEDQRRIAAAFEAGGSLALASVFPEPEAGPFRAESSSPKFEIDLLPEPFRAFVKSTVSITGLAPDYIVAGLLAASAAAIGTTRRVTTVFGCGYEEPPILWIGAIGPPAAAKTPALNFAKKAIEKVQEGLEDGNVRDRRNHRERKLVADTRRSQWESAVDKAVKAGEITPPMPAGADEVGEFVPDRILLGDPTAESVVKICAGLPRGVLLARDELPGWWSGFNRYNNGGGDREMWLEAFEGGTWINDRVKNGGVPVRAKSLAVSIVGGVQPDKLRDFLDGPSDGLAERFLWVWPNMMPTKVPTERVNVVDCARALERLRSLQFAIADEGQEEAVILPMSAGALESFRQFKARKDQLVASIDDRRAIRGALGKGDKIVMRLALVLELMAWAGEGGREPREISDFAMANAIHMWESYFRPVLFKVFDGGGDKGTAAARDLGAWIIRNGAERFTQTQVRESGLKFLKAAKDAKAALAELVEVGWVIPNFSRKGGTPGKSKQEYFVNPNVLKGNFLHYR